MADLRTIDPGDILRLAGVFLLHFLYILSRSDL